MKKENFSFLSAEGKTDIHAVRWIPEGEVKAILQIAHGMSEHIGRYEGLAEFLSNHGILVTGNDHLGHGGSVKKPEDLGYFAEEDGNSCVLSDMETLRQITAKLYPGKPYFLLGHSMGSFLCRQYIAIHGDRIKGALIMGTGDYPALVTSFAKTVCRLQAAFKGWRYRSELVNGLSFGGYNKGYGEKGGFQWLSGNAENVKKYEEDPLCGFIFTLNAFYGMFTSIHLLSKKDYVKRMPKELPVIFLSGDDDPVGNKGKAVKKVYDQFRSLGMKDVTFRLYHGDRHEILGESDRNTVYKDIEDWITSKE